MIERLQGLGFKFELVLADPLYSINSSLFSVPEKFKQHRLWDSDRGRKNLLNNLYLIVQTFICFNLIKFWLKVFPIPQLS